MFETIESTARFLADNDNYLVAIHDKADGDCFGSAVALCMILCKMGKKSDIISVSRIPSRLEFINTGNVKVFVGTKGLTEADFLSRTIISTDVASDQLLGEISDSIKTANRLAIDHHKTNTITAQRVFVDETASATGEIIYSICREIEKTAGKELLDNKIAAALYSAISSDSGCFKYSNTTSKTHQIASELMKYDIYADNINYRLFDLKSKLQIEVERMALQNLEYYCDGKIAFVYISNKQLEDIGASSDDAETVSQLVRTIEGVQMGVFMHQKKDGLFKFSTRSNNECDVSALCSIFGGGGHKKAAGCAIEGSAEQAKEKFLSRAKNFVE